MAVFASRQIVMPVVPPSTIAVTIIGQGASDYCYTTINGTKQYLAGIHDVNVGDRIVFTVRGTSSNYYGSVTIDGTEVLRVTTGSSMKSYYWTVPSGISIIEIQMSYNDSPSSRKYGKITVTTA